MQPTALPPREVDVSTYRIDAIDTSIRQYAGMPASEGRQVGVGWAYSISTARGRHRRIDGYRHIDTSGTPMPVCQPSWQVALAEIDTPSVLPRGGGRIAYRWQYRYANASIH
jgi:hypothetical protein